MKVIKRNDVEQDFCLDKIKKAIEKANSSVDDADKMTEEQVDKVIQTVQKKLNGFESVSVEDIQDFVEQSLVRHNKYAIAKSYILYRDKKKTDKNYTENEEKALSVLNGTSTLRGDNANKMIDDNGSIRDYLAGLLCKSIAEKKLPKDILKAHKRGLIHYHDLDYSPAMPLHNCDLPNVEDMFNNDFQMGNTKIELNEETPFETACNLLAQINLIVSGRQYGGQTVSWSHLLPFIAHSRNLITKRINKQYNSEERTIKVLRKVLSLFGIKTGIYNKGKIHEQIEKCVRDEIYKGVKTYQYQILSHMSSNGQTPFVSNNLCLREAETQQELDDFAMLMEEIFKRRIKGVKDGSGNYITPLFPKLLYWTCDGLNVKETDPYFYLTKLAAECMAKRMQPDIVSEKETRRVKQGQIIPSMGCRSLLSPIWEENKYPICKDFYWNRGSSYNYGKFIEKETFKNFENRTYKTGYEEGEYVINFRGNMGWLKEKTDEYVIIEEPKVYGRWNNGVVTINLPHVALESKESGRDFYDILDERLALCRKALKTRYESCCAIKAKNSSILWMHGALARMKADDTVGEFMKKHPKRASISLGYVGLFETCFALIEKSNTTDEGRKLSKEILKHMNNKCDEWKKEDNINYSIYGTPEESTTYKFALANRRDFGYIEHITDKDYVVNSYHVDPRENIDAFSKLKIEGEYLALSQGGAVSYVETLDLTKNIDVLIKIIQFMNDNILYSEVNRKIGVCHKCGYEGDIDLIKTENGDFKFICKNCGNDDDNTMDVTARICGYIGKVNAGNTNKGRLDDISHRVIHIDCEDHEY